jgi:hypothetical protein
VLEVLCAKWPAESNIHVHRTMCTYAFRLLASGSNLKVIQIDGSCSLSLKWFCWDPKMFLTPYLTLNW